LKISEESITLRHVIDDWGFVARNTAVATEIVVFFDCRWVGLYIPERLRIVPLLYRPDRNRDAHRLLSNKYWEIFSRGINRPEREADLSPIIAEITNTWIYRSIFS
jgi:hypothetical protein